MTSWTWTIWYRYRREVRRLRSKQSLGLAGERCFAFSLALRLLARSVLLGLALFICGSDLAGVGLLLASASAAIVLPPTAKVVPSLPEIVAVASFCRAVFLIGDHDAPSPIPVDNCGEATQTAEHHDQFPFLRSQVMHVGPPGAVSGIVTARASRKGPISPSALDRPMVHLLN